MDVNSQQSPRRWTRSSSLGGNEIRKMAKPRSSSFSEASEQSKRLVRFEVSKTMNRLRSSMVGRKQGNLMLSIEDAKPEGPAPRQEQSVLVRGICRVAGQIPAIILIGMFHLMIGIPFGVSYFPIGWRSDISSTNDEATDDVVSGSFPLPGKEALGIRMFLFSTIVGQAVFTFASGFSNPIGLQMVENVPFCHELAQLVIARQGYGTNALSTLFVMFGLASIVVGTVFYVLGKLKLGRIVYYFPTHVLVGCIGGIGLYIARTGMEVTIDAVFSLEAISQNLHLLAVVLVFEIILRVLEFMTRDENGKPRYSLLSPIYFCMITPVFYAVLYIIGVSVQAATDAGYFFPSLDECSDDVSADCTSNSFSMDSILDGHLFDIWTVIDFSVVSWRAIVDSIPTLVALTLFSLIHVPINIPAFALSTNTDADMNRELVAHGYSNALAGMFGGLQNYMAYTQSVLYDKSGGTGKASGGAVALLTSALFLVGPTIASYIPRCMAGTLLVHVGIDLFLEGVYDSYGKFDNLEYVGIWLIVVVMTLYGMDAAMIAGVITAISTYAVQNMTYVAPVRGTMSAATLRSSQWNRNQEANAILNDPIVGRNRILLFQLQGHLFFGNMAHLTESVKKVLSAKFGTDDQPLICILDFSLVLGIDSSAAQAMTKLKKSMQKDFSVELTIFVSGSDNGFPTDFDLSKELSAPTIPTCTSSHEEINESTGLLLNRVSSHDALRKINTMGSHVCDTLDFALVYAENALIDRQDPSLLDGDLNCPGDRQALRQDSPLADEREIAMGYLENLVARRVDRKDLRLLFSKFHRERYVKDDIVWKQASPGDSVKLLVHGTLIATLENEAGTSETIGSGNTIGELGLVEGLPRMSSVKCCSPEAVVYSLSREAYLDLVQTAPHAARLIDLICIRYLSARVQHVSNRIFETRCLPI